MIINGEVSVPTALAGEARDYIRWLSAAKGNQHKARYIVCSRNFDVSSMGECALKSPMVGSKHVQNVTGSVNTLYRSIPDCFIGGKGAGRPCGEALSYVEYNTEPVLIHITSPFFTQKRKVKWGMDDST